MTKMADRTHNLNYHKLSQKQVVIQVNIISYGSARRSIWPPELGSCQLVQVPCLGGCEPCQGWLCPRRRWRGEREGRGCLQGSGLWELLVTLALFEFKADGCMKLEDDQTPGTRPERPWLSWSAINTLYFPFLAILLSSHLCSLLLPPGCRLNRLDRSACEDQLTMNHHCLAQAQTGGIQMNSPGKSSIESRNFAEQGMLEKQNGGGRRISEFLLWELLTYTDLSDPF